MHRSVRRYNTIALGLLKKKEEEERRMPNRDFSTSHSAYVNCATTCIVMLYVLSLHWKSVIKHDGRV